MEIIDKYYPKGNAPKYLQTMVGKGILIFERDKEPRTINVFKLWFDDQASHVEDNSLLARDGTRNPGFNISIKIYGTVFKRL